MLALVTGRIVPMFTRNALRLDWIRSFRVLELSTIGALLVLTVADVWPAATRFSAAFAAAAGALLLVRMYLWGSLRTAGEPLLWVLHVGTLWLPLGLLLRAASASTSLVPESSSLHALTAGAIGSLTLGMMARVSLGHTGRLLKAPRGMTTSFLCVTAAAFVRVAAPLLPSSQYLGALLLATVAWSAAFVIFLVRYWPILVSPRVGVR